MESTQVPLRLRLILGKFQVTKTERGLTGTKMVLSLGGSVTMSADLPIAADVRVGDYLTLYTEVLADAKLVPPPIQ